MFLPMDDGQCGIKSEPISYYVQRITLHMHTCSLIKQPHKFYYDYGVVHNDSIKRHLHRTKLTRAFGIEGIQMSCGKIKSK